MILRIVLFFWGLQRNIIGRYCKHLVSRVLVSNRHIDRNLWFFCFSGNVLDKRLISLSSNLDYYLNIIKTVNVMKKIYALSFAASALLTPIFASAATTAELKLIGTIIPAACAPNFVGGSTIDYGNIPVGALNVTEQTMLPEKHTSLSVTCDAPVKFALSASDERSATVVSTLATIDGYTASAKYGLGTAENGAKIGAYSLQIDNETSGTGSTFRVTSSDGGNTWVRFGGGLSSDGAKLIGFSNGQNNAPAAHKSVTMDMRIVAAIDKAENLPVTDEINIDGLATIEVVYL